MELEEYQGKEVPHELHPGNQVKDQAGRLLNCRNYLKAFESLFQFHFSVLVLNTIFNPKHYLQ